MLYKVLQNHNVNFVENSINKVMPLEKDSLVLIYEIVEVKATRGVYIKGFDSSLSKFSINFFDYYGHYWHQFYKKAY
jgi:hypothetical protein